MPRKPSPCGTEAAYKRHLRHKEEPCDACREAHRNLQRSKRANKKPPIANVVPLPAPQKGVSRLDALEFQRDLLTESMRVAAVAEPKSVAGISRELRAVWAEIEELNRGEDGAGGADSLEILAGGLSVVPIGTA
ncbi:hypothetical protein FYJ24_09420 [Actinomycetaceae bacterium WB03_NA08]|uniref:Uncharacterized protein n=1 Tax=Scrofimicrobium canadense TaxID=2652290 RepID=A0A6N7WA05_9ACTO|nr:hypothetical protein [Scrofimicrobium canadense]MSS84978.1 hypothetical protein [Scrofimicrobium canadense]